jgi:catechol 2,3-dioxygenase-like lactoylglutathione lyase family enzyme
MLRASRLSLKREAVLVVLLGLLCPLDLPAQSPDLSGIAHVAFRVNDLDKSREFYHRLGFDQAFEFTDAGKTSVAYIKVNDRQFIELIPRTSDSQPGGILHTCFEAADIESVHKAYVERGLQPTEPKKGRAGNVLFVMHGPDGQLLEYTQYLPGSLHSLDRGKHLGEHQISQHMFQASTPVRDIAAERTFYINKLSFKDAASKDAASGGAELYIAGNSRDKIELQSDSPATMPRVIFAVKNIRNTAKDLRSRGLAVQKGTHTVFVTDPDGAVLAFAVHAESGK